MSTSRILFLLAVSVLLGLAGSGVAAKAAPPPDDEIYVRSYRLSSLSTGEAEKLVWKTCSDRPAEVCGVKAVGNGGRSITVVANAVVHDHIAVALASEGSLPGTLNLQLVLLVAGFEPDTSSSPLPENAQKAVESLKGFLPYTSYQLVDLGWMRASNFAQLFLKGPAGEPLEANISFTVRSPGEVFVDRLNLFRRKDASEGNRNLLSTSFNMKIGETLVVGTSKAEGRDRALVILLTMLP